MAQEEPDIAGRAAGGLGLRGSLTPPRHPPCFLAQVVAVALQLRGTSMEQPDLHRHVIVPTPPPSHLRPRAHVVQPLVEDDIPIPDCLQALQDVGATKTGVPGAEGHRLSGACPATGVPAPPQGPPLLTWMGAAALGPSSPPAPAAAGPPAPVCPPHAQRLPAPGPVPPAPPGSVGSAVSVTGGLWGGPLPPTAPHCCSPGHGT